MKDMDDILINQGTITLNMQDVEPEEMKRDGRKMLYTPAQAGSSILKQVDITV